MGKPDRAHERTDSDGPPAALDHLLDHLYEGCADPAPCGEPAPSQTSEPPVDPPRSEAHDG